MFAFADVKRGDADFGKFKIVGAINCAFLGTAVWNRFAPLPLRRGGEEIVHRRKAEADVLDVARFAPDVHAVDVDVGQSFLERIKRMLGVEFRAKESRFLGGCAHKKNRALRRWISFWKRTCQ